MMCKHHVFWGRLFFVLCLLGFSGCASVVQENRASSSIFNTYNGALGDYQRGRILEAREKVLNIGKKNKEYSRARELLRKKIEPARKQLLKHYKNRARMAASQRQWVKAEYLYQQSVLFSLGDASLRKKEAEMTLHIQQLRMNRLIKQRRKEDAILLSWVSAYKIPQGLDPRDKPFERKADTLEDKLDERALRAFVEAKRYLRHGYPEVAYVDIESHLRFQPESKMGKKLLKQIKLAFPHGLRIPSSSSVKLVRKPRKVQKAGKRVKADDIESLMRKGLWLDAYQDAIVYQKTGGKGADAYLKRIGANRKRLAADAFNRGTVAFQREEMDNAVKHLARAVDLNPGNAEYRENLQRARQLQERLHILRQEAKE